MSDAIRRHALNQSAFSAITEESAYWIGFLFADGYLRFIGKSASPRVELLLAIRDREHVERFRSFAGSSHALSVSKANHRGSGYARVSLPSSQLVADLQEHGMNNNSLAHEASAPLARSRDFWRGVVDGDGCLRLKPGPQGVEYPYLDLCGGKTLVSQFFNYATTLTSTRTALRQQGKIWRIAFNGKAASVIASVLYRNASISLERKREIATRIVRQSNIVRL